MLIQHSFVKFSHFHRPNKHFSQVFGICLRQIRLMILKNIWNSKILHCFALNLSKFQIKLWISTVFGLKKASLSFLRLFCPKIKNFLYNFKQICENLFELKAKMSKSPTSISISAKSSRLKLISNQSTKSNVADQKYFNNSVKYFRFCIFSIRYCREPVFYIVTS